MRHLTALVLIIMLAILPSCKYFKGKKLFGKKDKVMAEYLANQDSIRVADSLKKVQEQLLAMETARLDSIRLNVEAQKALASKYNIIVGSFITPEYAKAWSKEYHNRGYEAQIIKMEGSRFELVTAETHENFRKAVARLHQFQDTVQIDAWMYIKK